MCNIRINNPRPLATFNHICLYKDINKTSKIQKFKTMLQIISGYKLEGLSVASIGRCQSLESIDTLVYDFLIRSDYPVISNVLDFFTYWQLEETKLCQLLKHWQLSSTSIKYSKEAKIHTTSIEVVDFLLEYWPSNQISVIKESRILNKDLAQRIRNRGLDILR